MKLKIHKFTKLFYDKILTIKFLCKISNNQIAHKILNVYKNL